MHGKISLVFGFSLDLIVLKKQLKIITFPFQNQPNNLMGILVGDYSNTIKEGSGINIRMKKVELLDTKAEKDKIVENWKMVVDAVYFTGGDGKGIDSLSNSASNSFLSFELEEKEHSDTHNTKKYICKQTQSVFAHMALVRILSFWLSVRDEKIHWRKYLDSDEMLNNVSEYKAGIKECLEKGIMQYIINFIPREIPDFIPKK